MGTLLECVVETTEAAVAAERSGANRLELCVDLGAGGVTPPLDLVAAVAARVSIPVFVMIRPRAGDFVYSDREVAGMLRDAASAGARGAQGIVTGLLHADHRVDVARTRRVVEAAAGLPVTFHRAFDEVRDQRAAVEDLVSSGVRRVLTSGGAQTALEGMERLAVLVRLSADRVTVLAGGGVRAHNVRAIVAGTGVKEVHARFEDEAAARALARLL
ncbi:MAG TPA: copper homeostasis protein CutC [Vicinamibacterales bacterium]|nr:copper homeostasis protein CutC [Vicinamibacterales bacterium]